MSLFDWFGGEDTDLDVGNQVLKAFYNEASKYPEFTHTTYEAWITWIQSKVPDYVELIGQLVKANYASTSVEGSMERVAQLANASGGQATTQEIIRAAGGSGDTINWAAAVPEITVNTAYDAVETVSEAAQNIGQGVISTANTLKYLPWILGGVGVLFVYTWAKSSGGAMGGSVGQGIKSLADAGAERIRGRKNPIKKGKVIFPHKFYVWQRSTGYPFGTKIFNSWAEVVAEQKYGYMLAPVGKRRNHNNRKRRKKSRK